MKYYLIAFCIILLSCNINTKFEREENVMNKLFSSLNIDSNQFSNKDFSIIIFPKFGCKGCVSALFNDLENYDSFKTIIIINDETDFKKIGNDKSVYLNSTNIELFFVDKYPIELFYKNNHITEIKQYLP